MFELKAQKRDIFGKNVKNLLNQGTIPAEVYGSGKENIHVSILASEFKTIFGQAGESSIINLTIDGKTYPVLVHDVQKDSLGNNFIHIDFYQVRMDKKITTHVPLHFEGEAPAVKEKGGVLVKSVEKLEVEALPADLPSSLTVGLSSLDDLHKSVHIKDISVPSGVRILADPETVVATITEKVQEEVEVKEEVIEGAPVPEAEEVPQETPENTEVPKEKKGS